MGYGAIFIIAMIFVANFTVMIYVTVKRIVMHYKRYKMLKKCKSILKSRRGSRQLKKKRNNGSMMLDAVDALGGAMLEVIKEEEGDESYMDLE